MKKNHSTALFASAFVASLLLAPSSVGAQIFGYTGIKAGYSHLSVDRLELKSTSGSNPSDQGIYSKSFASSSIPFGGNVGLGYYFTPSLGFRAEAEYLYRIGLEKSVTFSNIKDGNNGPSLSSFHKIAVDAQTLLGNFYLDYYVTSSVNLYVSAGVGMSFLNTKVSVREKTSNSSIRISKTSFAWQVGLGTGYALTQSLGLDFNVRYVGLGKLRAGINIQPDAPNARGETPLSAVDALIGLNFRF